MGTPSWTRLTKPSVPVGSHGIRGSDSDVARARLLDGKPEQQGPRRDLAGSEMWIQPWLLLVGFASMILAAMTFVMYPRLADGRSVEDS
jgi:hypothetical protein